MEPTPDHKKTYLTLTNTLTNLEAQLTSSVKEKEFLAQVKGLVENLLKEVNNYIAEEDKKIKDLNENKMKVEGEKSKVTKEYVDAAASKATKHVHEWGIDAPETSKIKRLMNKLKFK